METAEVWNKLTSMCSGSSEGNSDSLVFSFYLRIVPFSWCFFRGVFFSFVTVLSLFVRGFFPVIFSSKLMEVLGAENWKSLLCPWSPARAEENTTFGTSCKKDESEPWSHEFSTSKQHNPSCIKGGCYFFSVFLLIPETFVITRIIPTQRSLPFCDCTQRFRNLIVLVPLFSLRINHEDSSR